MKKILLIAFSFLLVSCSAIRMETPQGFAHFHKETDSYRAVTAHGVAIKAYFISEDDIGEGNEGISLWQRELDLTLKARGYAPVETKPLDNSDGLYVEYSVLKYGKPYNYGIVLKQAKNGLFVVETGGLQSFYQGKKLSILESVKTLRKD